MKGIIRQVYISNPVLLLIGTLFWGCSLLAQDQAIFRHLGKKDGLSQGSVFSIAQDSSGYMWFGTRDGLNKYDGYQFSVYRKNLATKGSLVGNDIRILYFDKIDNALWIGTLSGLSRYDEARDTFQNFTTLHGLSSNSIRCILRDSKNRLWVGAANGLNLLEPTTSTFRSVQLSTDPNDVNREVVTLFEDSLGDIWIGMEEGLFQLIEKGGNYRTQPVLYKGNKDRPLVDFRVQAIQEDREGHLWIGTQANGVYRWDRKTNELTNYQFDSKNPYSLSNNNVRSMALSPNGEIWIGTFVGLNKFEKKRNGFRRYLNEELNPASLSNSSIRAIYFDKREGLWLGTYHGGVNYFDPDLSRFKNYEHLPTRNSLSNNIVSSFVEDEQGNFWIGTEGGGINYFNRRTGKFHFFRSQPQNPNSLSGNNVKTILKDGQQLWIGTFAQGVNLFDIPSQTFKHFKHNPGEENTLSDNNVYGLHKEGDQMWIVTYGGGLNILDLKSRKFQIFKNDPSDSLSLSSNLGRVIVKDSRFRIWIGTEKGLNLVDRASSSDLSLKFKTFLPAVKVYAIFEDKSGILWVGTFSDGLFAFNPNDYTFKQYTEADGLPGHTIFGVLQDEAGQIWLSTNNGISRFDIEEKVFTNYNYSNGLKNLEFNFNAHKKASSGEMLFGGTNGFTIFHPKEIMPNKYVPPLVFTDLKAFNQKVSVVDNKKLLPQVLNQTSSLTFKYNEAIFSIGFAALDYYNPSKNQYAYMLEGLDNDWNYTVGQTEANYTIQRPGIYYFRLKGANSDGLWNPQERRLKITVLPPPWLSGWAYLTYAILISGTFYGIWHFIRLRHDLQVEQIAKQQQTELNEMKLRFFTNITHEFRTPLTLILGPLREIMEKHQHDPDIHKKLGSVRGNAQRLLNLVNQILTFRKLETDHEPLQAAEDDIVVFLKQIFFSFEENARFRGIAYSFQSSDEKIMAWFDQEKLEKVFFNLLANAFKFTPNGGKITLNIEKQKNCLSISVVDSGPGIKAALHDQIFKRFYEKGTITYSTIKGSGIGLALSKQMIELHYGKIWVESEEGKGAAFFVELPLGNRHLEASELSVNQSADPYMPNAKEWVIDEHSNTSVSDKPVEALSENTPLLLIVEDNEEVQQFICNVFQKTYRIETANNGREGLLKAQKLTPALIISDIMMPEMDGSAMCEKIKSDIQTSHIPVILLTARAAQLFKNEGLETGADDYITKPFDPEELRLRVRNLIRSRKLMREKFVRIMNFEPKEITVTSADENFLNQAMEIAEKHIDNTSFTAGQFAYELAVSRPLLFKKIKALTDQTPNNFIKTLRLKRAAQLLEQGKLNVSEVAYRVGFKDTRYFSKCFQKQYQKTPSEFMNSVE